MKNSLLIFLLTCLPLGFNTKICAKEVVSIYSQCGYSITSTKYDDGREVFSVDFMKSFWGNGFHVKSGSPQDVYNEIKLFYNFVDKQQVPDDCEYEFMIQKTPPLKMLQIKLGSNEIRVDVKCIKGGKRAFEKYCKKNKIQLE